MSRYLNFEDCISMINNVNINGKTVKVPNNANVSIVNGVLFVNGEEHTGEEWKDKTVVNITIEGNVNRLRCQGSVTVNGNVGESVDCGGSASIVGDVDGDIDCGGSCTIKGKHTGSIDAGGSVSIR